MLSFKYIFLLLTIFGVSAAYTYDEQEDRFLDGVSAISLVSISNQKLGCNTLVRVKVLDSIYHGHDSDSEIVVYARGANDLPTDAKALLLLKTVPAKFQQRVKSECRLEADYYIEGSNQSFYFVQDLWDAKYVLANGRNVIAITDRKKPLVQWRLCANGRCDNNSLDPDKYFFSYKEFTRYVLNVKTKVNNRDRLSLP